MKKHAYLVLYGFIFLISFRCTQPDNKIIQAGSKIFSISEFIHEQESILKRNSITVNKISDINGKKEVVFFKPDTAFWEKEFEVFASTDIGKPAQRDQYRFTESDSSGFKTIKYESVHGASAVIPWLRIQKDPSGSIREITIKKQENNFLYQSARTLKMYINYNSEIPRGFIKGYSVRGSQKVIFRSRVDYEVIVNLDWAKSG